MQKPPKKWKMLIYLIVVPLLCMTDGIAQINLTLCMKISVLDEFDIRFSMYTIQRLWPIYDNVES